MKKKILTLTVAILVLAFSLVCFSACTTFDQVLEKVSDTIENVVAVDDSGTAMYDGPTYEMPRALKFFGASPNSNKTVRLTAMIEPASASDKSVDWSVSFVNPSSTWATGKTATDYVTVTPTSDGALTADVHFIANFGEQILVTVASREVSSVTASCTVDCYQDATSLAEFSIGGEQSFSIRHAFSNNGTIDLLDIEHFYSSNNDIYSLDSTPAWVRAPHIIVDSSQPYTVPASVQSFRFYVERSTALGNALASSFTDVQNQNMYSAVMNYTEVLNTSYNANNSTYPNSNYISLIDFYEVLFSHNLTAGQSTLINGNTYNRVVTALQNVSGTHFSVKVDVTYTDIGTVSYEYDMRFSNQSLGLVATSISMDQNAITF